MPMWEYCIVGPLQWAGHGVGAQGGSLAGMHPTITVLKPGQPQMISKINKQPGMAEHDVVMSLIAQLGVDGWEMVTSAQVGVSAAVFHFLYFKRPI